MWQLALGFTMFLNTALLPTRLSHAQADEKQIREVETRQAIAWNHHDGAEYAALFTPNGDVVNVVGWQWKGRAEIASKLQAGFAFVFHESVLTITDVQVRFLSPDIAVAHVKWTMVGARTPPSIPEPREGIQLQILRRVRGSWLIDSFQNTNSLPERPFPAGPVPKGQ
jgi:uncharacterized protein (TIGR02246 family)